MATLAIQDLQSGYDASVQPQMTLAATPGGVQIRDHSTPLTSILSLFNNNGTTEYVRMAQAGLLVNKVESFFGFELTLEPNTNSSLRINRHDGSSWAVTSNGTGPTSLLLATNMVDNVEFQWGGAVDDCVVDWSTAQTNNGLVIGLGVNSSAQSGTAILTAYANRNTDHGYAVSPNPRLYIASVTTPGTNWLSLHHDATNALLNTGAGGLHVAPGGTLALRVETNDLGFGATGNRAINVDAEPTGYGGIKYLPDGRTRTSTLAQAMLQWDSLVISNVPGGAPFGNDTAPAAIASTGECQFDDTAFLFATSLLFNQATTLSANIGNLGPVYTMVHQPTVRSVSAGAKTVSQMNAVRAQAKVGPNTAGSITQTSLEYYYATIQVDGTTGAASVTDGVYFAAKNPTLTGGGTIGTLSVLRIDNITGPTTIRGIDSAMSSGQFIRHTGTAPAQFGGTIELGLSTTFDVVLSRGAANRLDLASGDNFRLVSGSLQFVGTSGQLTSTVNGEIRFDSTRLGFGIAPAGANWAFGFSATARTITVGGDFANALNTAGGNHTINAALSTFTQWTVNAPGGTLGSGSVVDSSALRVQGNTSVGTNRYGLHVTSSPSGGTLNYCARFAGAAGVRIDGLLEHTGATVGLFGIAPAAQQTIVGSRGGNAALADLLTKGALNGYWIDGTSA